MDYRVVHRNSNTTGFDRVEVKMLARRASCMIEIPFEQQWGNSLAIQLNKGCWKMVGDIMLGFGKIRKIEKFIMIGRPTILHSINHQSRPLVSRELRWAFPGSQLKQIFASILHPTCWGPKGPWNIFRFELFSPWETKFRALIYKVSCFRKCDFYLNRITSKF